MHEKHWYLILSKGLSQCDRDKENDDDDDSGGGGDIQFSTCSFLSIHIILN